MQQSRRWTSTAAKYLGTLESMVLTLIGIVLVVLAVMLLVNSGISLIHAVLDGTMGEKAIEILDSVLLVMMTMEIVYTVAVSLESHTLIAEPFLIIGAIAAIRRMLVITAESTRIAEQVDHIEIFRSTLMELGLLAVIVIAMAGSIYVLRRSQRYNQQPAADLALQPDPAHH